MFPGLGLYRTDPARNITAADTDIEFLDRDLPDVWTIFLGWRSAQYLLSDVKYDSIAVARNPCSRILGPVVNLCALVKGSNKDILIIS